MRLVRRINRSGTRSDLTSGTEQSQLIVVALAE
jgi:hypothetical protein